MSNWTFDSIDKSINRSNIFRIYRSSQIMSIYFIKSGNSFLSCSPFSCKYSRASKTALLNTRTTGEIVEFCRRVSFLRKSAIFRIYWFSCSDEMLSRSELRLENILGKKSWASTTSTIPCLPWLYFISNRYFSSYFSYPTVSQISTSTGIPPSCNSSL